MEFGEMKRNTSNYSNFCMLLRRAGLTASAGLSCYPRDAMLARVFVTVTCLPLCPSVHPSVTHRYCVKTKKASVVIFSPSGSPISFLMRNFITKLERGHPERGVKQGSCGENMAFSGFKRQYLEKQIRPKLLLMTNRKSHLGFQLTPRSMTLDDLELQ